MPRWTNNRAEIDHHIEMARAVPWGRVARFRMKNGFEFYGWVGGGNVGSNNSRVAGRFGYEPAPLACYGDARVTLIDHSQHDIDFQDIEIMVPADQAVLEEFFDAGVLQRADWPS